MHVLKFEGEPEFTLSHTDETLEIGYGARFYGGTNEFNFYGSGGVMGETSIESSIESQSLGPQLSVRWTLRKGPWQARAEAVAALTYMNIDGDQHAKFGYDLIPGVYNRGLYQLQNRADSHLNEWDVSPALEAGVLAGYDVTPTTLCFIRGDVLQFGNVRETRDAVIFQLPRMGIRDPGGFDVTVTAATIGVEVRR
jgi:hypothetical protein